MTTMKKILALSLLLSGLVLSGCDNKFDNDCSNYEPVQMTPNTTIAELKAMYNAGPTIVTQKSNGDEIIVSGKVISTDRYGNFYRSFFIEDETSGIEVKTGGSYLFNFYPEGMTVYLKPKGLCLGAYGGMISLGAESSDPKYENSWIDAKYWVMQTVFRGALGVPVTPTVVTSVSSLTDAMLGKLVRLENATFVKTGLDTWAVPEDPETSSSDAAYGEQKLSLGGTITIRTSGYANFAGKAVPANGSIVNVTAVLTKFNTTWQLVLNSVDDVQVVSAP